MDDVSMIVEDLREPILKIKKLQEESLSIVISDIDFIIKNNVKDKNKIENLLDMLRCDWDTEEIYSFLIDSDIREFLLDNDLDARDTRYFRMAFINKIIGDVYEFESYNRVIKNIEIEKGVYQQFYYQISNIIDDAAKRLNFFVEHGVDLLNSYYFYHRQGDDFINQVQTYIYESKYFDTLWKELGVHE